MEGHVQHIRHRLDLENRTQVAAWYARGAPPEPEEQGQRPAPVPNNLPAQVTSFVGRQAELAEVEALLRTARLLTIAGPGGCGKTRLALELGTRLLDHYSGGAWLADLSPLISAEDIAGAVGAAIGASEGGGGSIVDGIVTALTPERRGQRCLLILDNCEHLVEGCGRFAEALLRACPGLTLLCTSRQPLRVAGEVVSRLGPLTLPGDQGRTSLALARRSDAVQLFLDRAALSAPGRSVTDDDAPALAQIVRRLDGMPLALELAAGHAGLMPVSELRRHLDNRLVLSGRRGLVPRQRTLAATMDWSHELIGEDERRLFRRLAVFSGGFTHEAARAVCAVGDEERTLELLCRLMDASLVAGPARDGRYRLLETIRHYALDHLRSQGELERLRRSHYAYYFDLASRAGQRLHGPDQAEWLGLLDEEHDNLRAALDYSRRLEPAAGLSLALALEHFWFTRGHLREGRQRLQAACDVPEAPATERARAQNALSKLAWRQGDWPAVRGYLEHSLALWQQLDDQRGIQACLANLGSLAGSRGDFVEARRRFRESLELANGLGDEHAVALLNTNLGLMAIYLHDFETAEEKLTIALAMMRRLGDLARVANILINLGALELERSRPEEARACYAESLALLSELGDGRNLAECLDGFACVAGWSGAPERALRLGGAARAIRERLGVSASSVAERLIHPRLGRIRAQLSGPAARRAEAAGQALSTAEAVELALAD